MQQPRVLNRIIALLALISLVLPASARAVSCITTSKQMACCMEQAKPEAKNAISEPAHSCCKDETQANVTQISEGKQGCHCIKSFPAQLPNKLDSFTSIALVDLVFPANQKSLASVEPVSTHRQKISFTDSSPPCEPLLSLHSGRAPPISVE